MKKIITLFRSIFRATLTVRVEDYSKGKYLIVRDFKGYFYLVDDEKIILNYENQSFITLPKEKLNLINYE